MTHLEYNGPFVDPLPPSVPLCIDFLVPISAALNETLVYNKQPVNSPPGDVNLRFLQCYYLRQDVGTGRVVAYQLFRVVP